MGIFDDLKKANDEFHKRGTVVHEPMPEPACCGGEKKEPSFFGADAIRKTIDAVKTGVAVAVSVVDTQVSDAEYIRRLSICTRCTAVDSKGEKFYRGEKDERGPTCGRYRAESLDAVFRDSKEEGCGCLLLSKAKGEHAHCPLSYW